MARSGTKKGLLFFITSFVFLVLILFGLFIASYSVLHNDLGYNGDIARDFLIYQDTVSNHKLPLIGPRTGGIDGLFHGPLWFYANLPAFIIGQGNPVVIGWFWIILVICSVVLVYGVSTKIFNTTVGFLSAALLSLVIAQNANAFLNPIGAAILSPLFLYCFYRYVTTTRVHFLIATLIVIGLLIQCEVAFGGPMLVLTTLYVLVFVYKKKKFSHLFSFVSLLLPLATYILFDIRHNFLQVRSVLGHIGAPTGNGAEAFSAILDNRWHAFLTSLMSLPSAPYWVVIVVLLFFLSIAFMCYRNKKQKHRLFFLLFTYFYLGYWPLSFYLNGNVLGIHIFPFIPMAIVVLAASYLVVRKEIAFVIIFLVLYFNVQYDRGLITGFAGFTGKSTSSWQFNYHLAQNVFTLAPKEFGYYVFTPDELGYGPKYALAYVSKTHPQQIAYLHQKKPTTFVIFAPTGTEPNNNRRWWVRNRVRIASDPVVTINYPNGYTIEKYLLSSEEVQIPSDPNLIDTLWFR